MTAYERRQSILERLRRDPGIRVVELAEAFNVSEGTIRNDLDALEEEGRLERVHGGAVLRERKDLKNTNFTDRHKINVEQKQKIGRCAAESIEDGESILLDASSTAYYLGLALESKSRLRVVTNGLDVARLMARDPTHTVILIGGILNPEGSSVTGLFSEMLIEELRIQKAFVSASGFSLERGMTEVHLQEAILKRKVIDSAVEVIALVDSSKFGKEDLTPFARIKDIHHLLTDDRISSEWQKLLEQAGVRTIICR